MKHKIVRISFALFKQILGANAPSKTFRVISDGIPKDAELVSVSVPSSDPDCIDLRIKSESFPEVDKGALIPFLTPVCELVS